jgi:uncharacterized protein (DUF169 family)
METLEKNKKLTERFKALLSIPGNFVALKMMGEMKGFERVKRPKKRLTLCQQIAQTYFFGRSTLLQVEDINCYACGEILGLGDMPKEAWKRYVGWLANEEEVARRIIEAVPKVEKGRYHAVVLTPLQHCPVEPDVVLFAGNAAQMVVVIGAYLHKRGDPLTFKTTGINTCAAIIVPPINEQRPSIAITGNAPRLLAFPSDTDLLCGLPGSLLEELAENMEFMRARGAANYPPGWQHIGQELQPPIADLLKDDGEATWLK